MSFFWEIVRGKFVPPKDTRPSFKGRNVVVTGANVGLGYEAAVKFVQLGAAKVILGVRTISKGEDAKHKIEERTGRNGVVDVWHIDMLDYTTIKAFAERADKELDHLDIAVVNAGVAMASYKPSPYGYEQTMQVNVLSTALLSLLLLPKLKASQTDGFTPVLEISASSNQYIVTKLQSGTEPLAMYIGPSGYKSPLEQYSVSKLFVMYIQTALTQLATSGDSEKPAVYITTVCPGATQSDLARDATAWYLRLPIWLFSVLLQRKTEEGARTYISGVSQGEKAHGRFWKDDRVREPAPLMIGENGERLQKIVWSEIVEALKKDVPEVQQLAAK